jgi:uncharacterized protein (TIGR02118 family)
MQILLLCSLPVSSARSGSAGGDALGPLVALFPASWDPAAFDRHYETTHVEIARKMPGLRSVELSKGPVVTAAGDAYYSRVGTLRLDSKDDLQKAVVSQEGETTAADVMNVATDGVTLLFFDTIDI